MLLNLGISGYSFVGDDIGGYAGSPSPELLTRWLELGVFNPFYRDHTEKGTADQEPWVQGPEQETIRRQFIELRYQLLPYIYTGMEEASRTGIPLMRPMFLEFPKDTAVATTDTEFMFGRAFLVAPKLSDGAEPVLVRLPAGNWYDYWTGEAVSGGYEKSVTPALNSIPLFVRAGSIIPRQPVVQYVGEAMRGPITLDVYPGPDCHGELYADDGSTFAYRNGEFQRTEFTCEQGKVTLGKPIGNFKPDWNEFEVRIHGATTPMMFVTVNGVQKEARFDASTHVIAITVPAGAQTVIQY
jgi:alpha-glucosidase